MFIGSQSHKRFRKNEFDLPEPIIHVIQSFLTSKQAARTTILSKPWRSAWLTRPNLDFDHADLCVRNYGYSNLDPIIFLHFANITLERYENSDLKIESFRLSMKIPIFLGIRDVTKLVHSTLVHRALKLGPTRLTLEFRDYDSYIPNEVFVYENLVSLTARGCGINLNRAVCCSRLRSLSLNDVFIESRDMVYRVLSSFPLIEKLSLCHVHVRSVNVGDGLRTNTNTKIICRRLTSLVLFRLKFFDTVFLVDLSSKFPSLKDLTLNISEDREEILISSPTLERLDLNMEEKNHREVKLDIPSIRKFTFVCSSIPYLSITSNSTRWEESYVSVKHCTCPSATWFYRLSNFIMKLGNSRISMSLNVSSQITFDYEAGDVQGRPTREIENLDIYHLYLPTQSCYVLFDGLFRICHPKLITQYMPNNALTIGHPETKNIHFLGKRLLEARDAKVPIQNYQFMYGLNDLKETRIQVFDEEFNEWRDEEPLDALSDYMYYLPTPGIYCLHQKVRFRLYWKP